MYEQEIEFLSRAIGLCKDARPTLNPAHSTELSIVIARINNIIQSLIKES